MKGNKKLYFFIRANNDVDHFAPIIHELSCRDEVLSLDIINWNVEEQFGNDFRIEFLLQSKKVRYSNVFDQVKDKNRVAYLFVKKYFGFLQLVPKIRTKYSLFCECLKSKIDYKNYSLNQFKSAETMLLLDHSIANFPNRILNYANQQKLPIGLLMHGLDPTENVVMSSEFLFPQTQTKFGEIGAKSTQFFVNNELYGRKCIIEGVPKEKVVAIGSPRFSYSWSKKLDAVSPKLNMDGFGKGKLKVVIMLSKWMYNNWEEETHRVIQTILKIEGIFLVIKPHTRGMKFQGSESDNCFIDNTNHFPSRNIIEWSDVVLFSISSIFLEALLLKKPVLHLRLATSNKLACSGIMQSWNIDCRDELIDWMNRFKENPLQETYTEVQRRACLDYYVQDENEDLMRHFGDAILKMN